MELENEFEVAAPVERVWEYMLDLERVTPCMPGAELDERPDENTWKGKVTVKLGAVSLSYAATAVIEERDESAHRVVIEAQGRETRGKGRASATINSTMEPDGDGGTRVAMHTDLKISGAAARYGRGMIADVSKRLTGEFADCLKANIETAGGDAGDGDVEPDAKGTEGTVPVSSSPPRAAAKPVGGIRLAVWAVGRAVLRGLGRVVTAIRSLFSRR